MDIKQRVFIVTGASSGIGLATATALSHRGGKVALLARNTAALEKLAIELPGSLPVTADMTRTEQIVAAVTATHRHYGHVDGLINNAGRSYAATVEQIDPKLFDEIFHLNVLAPILAMQAVVPLMRLQGAGSIVNVNSGTAFMNIPGYSVYASSKRALLGFSMAARTELERDHISVSEVYPDRTATNFGKNRIVGPEGGGPPADYSDATPPAVVAELITKAVQEGRAQYFGSERIAVLAGAGQSRA